MAEHYFTGQSNMGMSNTLKMARPVPAIADRIFDKLADIEEFIQYQYTSAIPGLILSVIDDDTNNGIYQVVIDSTKPNNMDVVRIDNDTSVSIKSYIQGTPVEESSTTDYIDISVGNNSSKIYTMSTDMLRNGTLTLVIDGSF